MLRESIKCMCGDKAYLELRDKKGRYKDTIVTVKNVPIYVCYSCGESTMQGIDSIHFAKKVKEAYFNKNKTSLFNNNIHY